MGALFIPTLNFVILVGVLVYFLRKPLGTYVLTRHQAIQKTVSEVAQLLHSSTQRFKQVTSQLSTLESETQNLQATAKREGEELRKKLLEQAQKSSGLFSKDAQGAGQVMMEELKRELRSELAHRAVARAEETLRKRLTGDDRVRIRQEFSNQMAHEMGSQTERAQ